MNTSKLHSIDSTQIRIQTGRVGSVAWPDINRYTFFRKRGGEWVCYSFSPRMKGDYILPEEKRENDIVDPDNSITVQYLIRAADLAHDRGQMCENRQDRAQLEDLGITINILRRAKNIKLDELARHIQCKEENLIALESGLLSFEQVCELLPAIVQYLGVNVHAHIPENLKFVTLH